MEDLTHDEIADVIEMPTQTYCQRVIALFTRGQATPEHWETLTAAWGEELMHRFKTGQATAREWLAMAQAVRHISNGQHGAQVASIDRAVLAMRQG